VLYAKVAGVPVLEYAPEKRRVRRALDTEVLLGAFEAARADLVPIARAKGLYTDEDVFRIVS
jgi:hypothetical protein